MKNIKTFVMALFLMITGNQFIQANGTITLPACSDNFSVKFCSNSTCNASSTISTSIGSTSATTTITIPDNTSYIKVQQTAVKGDSSTVINNTAIDATLNYTVGFSTSGNPAQYSYTLTHN